MTTSRSEIILNMLQQATPWNVFAHVTMVTKICAVIALVTLVIVVVTALVRRSSNGTRSELLAVAGYIGLGFATLGGLYIGTISLTVAYRLGTDPLIVLPSMIEVAYSLALGLLNWGIAFWGNHGARRA